jgi:hypothetical protein
MEATTTNTAVEVNSPMAVEEVVNNNSNMEATTTNTAVEVNSPMAAEEVVNNNPMVEETIPMKEARVMIRIKAERNTLTVVITKALDTVPSLSHFSFISSTCYIFDYCLSIFVFSSLISFILVRISLIIPLISCLLKSISNVH